MKQEHRLRCWLLVFGWFLLGWQIASLGQARPLRLQALQSEGRSPASSRGNLHVSFQGVWTTHPELALRSTFYVEGRMKNYWLPQEQDHLPPRRVPKVHCLEQAAMVQRRLSAAVETSRRQTGLQLERNLLAVGWVVPAVLALVALTDLLCLWIGFWETVLSPTSSWCPTIRFRGILLRISLRTRHDATVQGHISANYDDERWQSFFQFFLELKLYHAIFLPAPTPLIAIFGTANSVPNPQIWNHVQPLV